MKQMGVEYIPIPNRSTRILVLSGWSRPSSGHFVWRQRRFSQHASASRSAERLAQLNFDLAQMLAGLPFEEFLDEKRNHFRLREIVAINCLTNRANGWIYTKTYARRGVRQSEDEDAEGRSLLGEIRALSASLADADPSTTPPK